jgi:hypothetical protein
MKINFDSELKALDGAALQTGGNESKPFTLKLAAVEALMRDTDQDAKQSGEQKLKRFDLAERIFKGGEIEITPEEAALIKERIGKGFTPAVVGPAFRLLNG